MFSDLRVFFMPEFGGGFHHTSISDELDPIVAQDYFNDGTTRSPRYYQQIAINRTVEAIARNEGSNRHLLQAVLKEAFAQ